MPGFRSGLEMTTSQMQSLGCYGRNDLLNRPTSGVQAARESYRQRSCTPRLCEPHSGPTIFFITARCHSSTWIRTTAYFKTCTSLETNRVRFLHTTYGRRLRIFFLALRKSFSSYSEATLHKSRSCLTSRGKAYAKLDFKTFNSIYFWKA